MLLREQGVADMPLGVDIVEPPMMFALQEEGITVIDGQQIMLDAREIKSPDEIMLLTTACAMVDGAYQLISEVLKPGIRRERDRRAREPEALRARLRRRRGDQRGLRRTVQPAPPQLLRPNPAARRPGVLRHHPVVQRLSHLLLPHPQRRPGDVVAARRLHQGSRVDRRRDPR